MNKEKFEFCDSIVMWDILHNAPFTSKTENKIKSIIWGSPIWYVYLLGFELYNQLAKEIVFSSVYTSFRNLIKGKNRHDICMVVWSKEGEEFRRKIFSNVNWKPIEDHLLFVIGNSDKYLETAFYLYEKFKDHDDEYEKTD